jgi:hypothetical protein
MITRRNQGYLWVALSMSILIFSVFKHFYPNPNMVMDSYIYLKAAVNGFGADSFPIGYSKFLEVFLLFSKSPTMLVWLQYLLLESACLFLFLTILFFFQPSKITSYILFVFFFCNPLFLFSCNFIMSDALFSAISIFWVAQIIWIIGRPRPYMILIQATLILLAFTVRYNALYYPVVASVFLLLSRLWIWQKVIAIFLQFLFIGVFVQVTRNDMHELTGVKDFSPLGGWHIANDALYMYSHVYTKDKDSVPANFQPLDSTVRHYFDHTQHVESLLHYDVGGGGAYYLADARSPLLRYMYWRYGSDTIFQDFKKWGPMGVLCSEYGSYLIRKHPLDFIRYYVWPNIIRYGCPPEEIFVMYSPYFLRQDDFGKMAMQSFKLKTLMVDRKLIKLRATLASFYPILFGILNLFLIIALSGFCFFNGIKKIDKINLRILCFVVFLWILNFFFSIVAASVVLRYQIFMFIVLFVVDLLLAETLYRINDHERPKQIS